MWNRAILIGGAVAGVLAGGAQPLPAQAARDTIVLYEREVFEYARDGRPDPFRSLLKDPELGMRFEDLTLVGVLHDGDPGRSVAILSQVGSARRLRVRVGERVGSVRILAIGQRSVDLIVEEFGVARRERLELKPATEKGGTS